MSKERKKEDGETYESWLAAVINRILVQSGLRGVIVGSRIINVFKKKLSTMYSAMKRATKSGGRNVKLLMNAWQFGAKYKFTIYYAGCARIKKKYKCSNCDNEGHNIKTCTSKCKICGVICCAHLINQNGRYHPKCTAPESTITN